MIGSILTDGEKSKIDWYGPLNYGFHYSMG